MGIQQSGKSRISLTMKLLLISTVLGSLLSLVSSKANLQSIIAISQHFQNLEPADRAKFVEVAANVVANEVQTTFTAEERGIDIPGCIDCALSSFDASCLISTCLCSVFTMLPEMVLQIFQMIGLCPRAGAAAPAAAPAARVGF